MLSEVVAQLWFRPDRRIRKYLWISDKAGVKFGGVVGVEFSGDFEDIDALLYGFGDFHGMGEAG